MPARCYTPPHRPLESYGEERAFIREATTLDLEYIESWNLWLDIKLLLKTVLVIVKGLGQ